MMRIPNILSIAGTDPTGGAGIHADLKSIAATGGYGMAAITALVAQSTQGVRAVHTPPSAFLAEQLDVVSDDVTIDAVKIGMLGDVATIAVVRAWLERVRPPIVVLDPVMVATSGDRLLQEDAVAALVDLLPLADCITPNVPELAILAGAAPARDAVALLAQAREVAATHGVRVLAKGGHLDGAIVDRLVEPDGSHTTFTSERVETTSTHGTGCSLSSALATLVARGLDWSDATAAARDWLAESLRSADDLDVGHGHGPVHHLAGLWARGGLESSPTPGAVRSAWWASIAECRAATDALPFVEGLADGTLPREAFRWYLAQDAVYLGEYARLLAIAASLAPSPVEQSFWAASAQSCIHTELQLHEAWLADEPPAASTTTVAYLDHLRARASDGYSVLAAALLPCFWLYGDLGERLLARSHADHAYADWISTYGDESFASATQTAIDVVTSAAAAADAATRARMLDAFTASAWHEHAFFAAPMRR